MIQYALAVRLAFFLARGCAWHSELKTTKCIECMLGQWWQTSATTVTLLKGDGACLVKPALSYVAKCLIGALCGPTTCGGYRPTKSEVEVRSIKEQYSKRVGNSQHSKDRGQTTTTGQVYHGHQS